MPEAATTDAQVYSIPEAISRVQTARAVRDEALAAYDVAADALLIAGKDARRSGVSVARIAEEVGLSRQQAHRLFGSEPKVDGA